MLNLNSFNVYFWVKDFVMVIFNDLRITEEKDCIVVDCQIEDVDGYDGMYIDSVDVEYYKNATDDMSPSDKAINIYTAPEGDTGRRWVRCTLNASQLDIKTFGTDTFDNGLFFVIVRCDGTPENPDVLESYSCGADNTVDIGAVLDWQSIYTLGMKHAAKLAYGCTDICDVPSGFESFILYWYALQLAISTCDWLAVKKLWDKFMRSLSGITPGATLNSGCGCRG